MNDYAHEPLTERLTIEVGASLRRDLARWAKAEDRPVSYMARRAIAHVVAKHNRESERAA